MPYKNVWEDFEKEAEKLYLQNPSKVRYTMKYVHSKNVLILKMTDNTECLLYKTEAQQDIRKINKFVENLMRHMASKA